MDTGQVKNLCPSCVPEQPLRESGNEIEPVPGNEAPSDPGESSENHTDDKNDFCVITQGKRWHQGSSTVEPVSYAEAVGVKLNRNLPVLNPVLVLRRKL